MFSEEGNLYLKIKNLRIVFLRRFCFFSVQDFPLQTQDHRIIYSDIIYTTHLCGLSTIFIFFNISILPHNRALIKGYLEKFHLSLPAE